MPQQVKKHRANVSQPYSFPAIGCKEGSAWHSWMTAGAVWGTLHNVEDIDAKLAAAKEFADESKGNARNARRAAFLKGIDNREQLEVFT